MKPYLLLILIILFSCGSKTENQLSPRFNHVYLTVADVDRSVAFYTTAFDLKVTAEIKEIKRTPKGGESERFDINLSLLKFDRQGFVLEISERSDFSSDNQTANFTHLGIDVKDIEAASERVLNAGGTLLRPITLVEAGEIKAKTTFFTGPDGETIELMEVIAGEF